MLRFKLGGPPVSGWNGHRQEWRERAVEAGRAILTVVEGQFGVHGQPWFLDGIPGQIYLKREWETDPYVQFVYVPNATLVGPENHVEFVDGTWHIVDEHVYPTDEISDAEFATLQAEAQQRRLAAEGST